MFIPKGKMPFIVDMLEDFIDGRGQELGEDEKELINQMIDRANLCRHGDALWLEVEVCYAHKPK